MGFLGLGTITPLGSDTKLAFDNILRKDSAMIKSITEDMNEEDDKFGPIYSRLSSRIAARVPSADFNAKKNNLIESSDLRSMSR